jgi:hypothetical protein
MFHARRIVAEFKSSQVMRVFALNEVQAETATPIAARLAAMSVTCQSSVAGGQDRLVQLL